MKSLFKSLVLVAATAFGASTAQAVELTGSLLHYAAIGGDTTGIAIETADGTVVEIDANGLLGDFEDGERATVQGEYETREGVERGEYTVLAASALQLLDRQHILPVAESFTGTMRAVMAIGGETTGMALELEGGTFIEIDLRTNDLARRFRDGAEVTVVGSFTLVRGVEIPSRRVFVVTAFR